MASFLVDINISGVIEGVLRRGENRVDRAPHGMDDDEIVDMCLSSDAILVTFNREEAMAHFIDEGLGKGLRAVSLASTNLLTRRTRLRIEIEMASKILGLAGLCGPFLCRIELDEARRQVMDPYFEYGGPTA